MADLRPLFIVFFNVLFTTLFTTLFTLQRRKVAGVPRQLGPAPYGVVVTAGGA